MIHSPKLEYAMICDDIRHEVGDKFSLIGVYGSDIYAANMPFLFPKLSVAIAYRHLKGGDTFHIELIDPAGTIVSDTIRGEVPTEVSGLTRFIIFGSFPPLRLEKQGRYTLAIVINGDREKAEEVSITIKAADTGVVH